MVISRLLNCPLLSILSDSQTIPRSRSITHHLRDVTPHLLFDGFQQKIPSILASVFIPAGFAFISKLILAQIAIIAS